MMVKIEKRVGGTFYEVGIYDINSQNFFRVLRMLLDIFDPNDIQLTVESETLIKIEKRVDGVFYEEGIYGVDSKSFLRALKILFSTFDIEDIKLTEVD